MSTEFKMALTPALKKLESHCKKLAAELDAVDEQIDGLRSLLGQKGSRNRTVKKTMSAAARKRISEAMKKSWAKKKSKKAKN